MEYDTSLTSKENSVLVEQKSWGMTGNVPEWGGQNKTAPKEKNQMTNQGATVYFDYDPDKMTYTKTYPSAEEKKYRDILAKVDSRKSLRYNLDVPEGFSPFNYDDYIDELKGIELWKTELSELKNKKTKTQGDLNKIRNIERFLDGAEKKLKNRYYNPKFPKGITSDDLEFFNQRKKEIEQELKDITAYTSRGPSLSKMKPGFFLGGLATGGESWMDPRTKRRYESLKNELNTLQFKFGYDPRTAFDKFMDSNWGLVFQVATNLLLAVTGELTGGLTWGLLADALFNASIGAYQWSRDQRAEAMMSFVFAVLPYMRNLHRLAGSPSKAITDSIAQKLLGKSLNSSREVNAFLEILTKEEREVWKKLAYIHPDKITPEIEQLLKTHKEAIKKISTRAERFGKGVKRFGTEAMTDLVIAYTFSEVYNKLMEVLKKFGVKVKTQSELDSLKAWLKEGATPNDLDKVMNYSEFFFMENPNKAQEYKTKGFNLDKFIKDIKSYQPSKEAIEKRKKEIELSGKGGLEDLL